MGKKKKLRKHLEKRGADHAPTLVICIGKDCCSRSKSRALVEDTRAYVAEHHPNVHLKVVGCLHICKKGPIAATYPEIKFKKRVDAARAHRLVDKLDRRASPSGDHPPSGIAKRVEARRSASKRVEARHSD